MILMTMDKKFNTDIICLKMREHYEDVHFQ